MSESKSTSVSLDVFSAKTNNCPVTYALKILRPHGKYKGLDPRPHFQDFLQDVKTQGDIVLFIGDNPKRALARDSLSHSSYYPCEYCFARGIRHYINSNSESEMCQKLKDFKLQKEVIEEKLANATNVDNSTKKQLEQLLATINEEEKNLPKNKSQTAWPANTANAEPRSREKILEILTKIETSDTILPAEETKGIIRRSLFLDIPGFNFVRDIPVDYLHAVCLGVVKRLLELTFTVGDNRPRITKRKLSNPADYNKQMGSIKVPREFSRRSRALDFSVLKGQELRNIILFFFPLVLHCIEPTEKERKLWLLLTFMIRSCILPECEFSNVNKAHVKECCDKFYTLYESLFSVNNCSYNTHVVASHLLQMRENGPLTMTSAFGFESFYGEMRHSFVPRTISPLKQIMQTILLKRTLAPHCCSKSIYYSSKDTSLENNSMIYTFSDNKHVIYKIVNCEDTFLECKRIGQFPAKFTDLPSVPWNVVGVFKKGGIAHNVTNVHKSDVPGKVLSVLNYLDE